MEAVHEARGEGLLSIGNLAELRHFVDDFEFEHSILIWHCAAEICYQVDAHVDGENNRRRKFGKVLSDYMTYLFIKQPKLMTPVAGIKGIRYRETIVGAKNICKRHPVEIMEQFCKNILDEHIRTAESVDRRLKDLPETAPLAAENAKWDASVAAPSFPESPHCLLLSCPFHLQENKWRWLRMWRAC
ncbi:hypothetical protein MLD38_037709 [Melastoma candidum]|uniref:Uncharacterized protein n=1 Tax=Melastoma candidum TaxID=119954 RepID=A0ACB9LNU9_9MYRT|nr:hypothetical protein MLD38_037709 [Melastoma candidum]